MDELYCIKVPKHLAESWSSQQDKAIVGNILKICKNKKEFELIDYSNNQKYGLHASNLNNVQNLFSFHEESHGDIVINKTKIKRLDCKIELTDSYLTIKKNLNDQLIPKKQLVRIHDNNVQTFKPIANHITNIEHEKRKKEEGKRSRGKKEEILELLFAAFEKNKHYNIHELMNITQQPMVYLKDILKDICEFNTSFPHKNTWHLKNDYKTSNE